MDKINQSFIKEHFDDLLEFRDIDEVKYYLKDNKINISNDEIENFKKSIQLAVNGSNKSCILCNSDLANVSGGMNSTGAAVLGLVISLVGLGLGLAACKGLTAITPKAGNFYSLFGMMGQTVGQVFGQLPMAEVNKERDEDQVGISAAQITENVNTNNTVG